MIDSRYLEPAVAEDLGSKMVFLAGPRQVGKTTLARRILSSSPEGRYYLWDNRHDRTELLQARWPAGNSLIVLDELHKYLKWKSWLKGEYDKHKDRLRFLITGSARLDIYRKGGDSLQGRYHHYRLHPVTVAEENGTLPSLSPGDSLEFPPSTTNANCMEPLLKFGGFPEPFFAQSERVHRRWQKERLDRFFREDVRDLETVRDLSALQIMADLIPARVGSPFSLNALRGDLEVSHRAVTHWVDILERLYYLYRIRPYFNRRIASLRKEPKVYLWDWTLVQDPGARFENLIASHLLKFCHYLQDREGYRVELYYLRDPQKREVDFLVTSNEKPWFAVEAKLSETDPAPALRYYGEKLKIPYLFQVVLNTPSDTLAGRIRILPAWKFLSALV